MYEAYWQLERRPFDFSADPGFYYPCEAHQGALLKIRYAIENGRGAALLSGASGVGKTLVVQMLKRQLAENCRPLVHIVYPQMPVVDLLAYIADELCDAAAPHVGSDYNIKDSVRRMEHLLAQNANQARRAVLVIDEAHLIDDHPTWEALRLLGNFQGPAQPFLTTLICGQPALLPIMDRMPQWEERLAVKCLLRPFTLEETMSYISYRLTCAGATTAIFDTTALEAVHYATHGNARKINRLCDLALLIAFAEELSAISAAQIDAVSHELVNIAPE